DAEKKSVRPTTVDGFVNYLDKSLHENKNTKIAVVLAHDATNKQLTVDSLRSIIKYFKDRDYEFGVLK
ncbi:MAG: polysaccharide deacetylase, partial [Peptoniphilus sp.]|nr:polysaccharide deacetylase [Peptoniphilus sp.]